MQVTPGTFATVSDLKQQTLRGGLAGIGAQGASFVVRMGSTVVLARLLDPRDFGLVAMVTAVTGVFSLFKDAGLSLLTIQRPTLTHDEISMLFWLNVLVSALLTILSIALAPALAAFYGEPRLFAVTLVLALGFLINGAGVQHSAYLQRQMRFSEVAAIDVISLVASVTVAVGFAAGGLGYWALVAMAITGPVVSTLGAWWTSRWVPGRPRDASGAAAMLRFGGIFTFNRLIMYAAYNADKLLLGRIWGAEALGLYGRAYQLVNVPTDSMNTALGGVVMSALSRLQGDPKRFKSYFLKAYSLILAVTMPATIGCAVFADDIILVLFGPKWTEAVPIFRFLTPTIMVLALFNPAGWVLLSTGQLRRSLQMAFVLAPVVVLGYVTGIPYGPGGVAIGYSVAMVALAVPILAWAMRGSEIAAVDLYRAAITPFVYALGAVLIGFVARTASGQRVPLLVRLILEVGISASVYVWALLRTSRHKQLYLDVIRDLLGRRSASVFPAGS
jgi:PST family polysaccharide transporter